MGHGSVRLSGGCCEKCTNRTGAARALPQAKNKIPFLSPTRLFLWMLSPALTGMIKSKIPRPLQDNPTFLFFSPLAIYGLAAGSQRLVMTTILFVFIVVFGIFAFAGFVIFFHSVVIARFIFLAAQSNVGQQRSHQNYEDASPHLWIISAGLGRYVVNVDQLVVDWVWVSVNINFKEHSLWSTQRTISLMETSNCRPTGKEPYFISS